MVESINMVTPSRGETSLNSHLNISCLPENPVTC